MNTTSSAEFSAGPDRRRRRWARRRGWLLLLVLLGAGLTATAVPAGAATVQFAGSLNAAGDNWDAHTFQVTAAGTITATLSWTGTANLNLGLKNPNGTWVTWATSPTANPEQIVHDTTLTGTWTLGISAKSGTADYTLDVTTGGDPPPPPPSDLQFAGSVNAAGDNWDTHTFQVTAAGTITATLSWTGTANLNLGLKNPNGTWVTWATSPTANPEQIVHDTTLTGTWTLGISAKSGTADYTLDVGAPTAPPGGGSTNPVTPVYRATIGGPGHATMYPSGLDVDEQGAVYVADTGNDSVSAYSPDGTHLWTTGKRLRREPGSFSNPRDVAYADGKVYVADTAYNRVQVLDAVTGASLAVWSSHFTALMGISAGVDGSGQRVLLLADSLTGTVTVHRPDGTRIRTVGSGLGTGDGQLNEARDAATDAAGNIYVADFRNHRVARFSPTGEWLGSWGMLGSGVGQFNAPYGIDVDEAGHVYVADSNNGRIQELDGTGAHVATFGSAGGGAGQFFQLRRVAVGAGNRPSVHGADLWGLKIERFSYDGTRQATLGGSAPPDGGFNEPYGVVPTSTNVFVADTTNQRIQRFSASGNFELAWGARGWGDDILGLNWPRDVTYVAATGMVWVSDTKNNRVTEYRTDGTATGRTLGTPGTGQGQLQWPHAVVAHDTHLVIADTNNNRIKRWNPDNTGGNSAVWVASGFNHPKDVTIADGIVYVADSLNGRIVRLDADTGTVIDTFGETHLHQPEGVAVTPWGTVWVSDTTWNRLIEFAADGSWRQTVGQLGSDHGRFNRPGHLETRTTSARTELLVVDMWNDRVEVFDIK